MAPPGNNTPKNLRLYKYSSSYYRRLRELKRQSSYWKGLEPNSSQNGDTGQGNISSCIFPDLNRPFCDNNFISNDGNQNVIRDNGEQQLPYNLSDEGNKKCSDVFSTSITRNLKDFLRDWALKNNITHLALTELLCGLASCGIDGLPKDSRTLLKTPQYVDIEKMGNDGEFWYYGLQSILMSDLSFITEPQTILLNFHIDGLPVNNSSKHQFWPILTNFVNMEHISPKVVAIYYGNSKPNPDQFFAKFITELEHLLQVGFFINGIKVSIKVNCFICDTPARNFIKCTVGFNAYNSCNKCTVAGEYFITGRHMSFPRTNCSARTNDTFRQKEDKKHHLKNSEGEPVASPLEKLPIDMIKDFPIADSLHLLDFGVMKRCLTGWLNGNFNFRVKFSRTEVAEISLWLENSNVYAPSEIHRSIRGLDTLSFWKATEYRTFLLYLGAVVLKNNLNSEMYNHFLLFFCAVTICSCNYYVENKLLLPLAKHLFDDFVENYISIYGLDSISSNVHNLTHIVNDVEKFGSLPTISAYPFENALGHLKRLLRSGNRPLAQAAKRLLEHEAVFKINKSKQQLPLLQYEITGLDKPLKQFNVFKKLSLLGISFQANLKDQWFLTKNDSIIKMECAYLHEKEYFLYGCPIRKLNNFFYYPFESKNLNIYKCDDMIYLDPVSVSYKDIKCKLFALKYQNKFVFFPLLHTLDCFVNFK